MTDGRFNCWIYFGLKLHNGLSDLREIVYEDRTQNLSTTQWRFYVGARGHRPQILPTPNFF